MKKSIASEKSFKFELEVIDLYRLLNAQQDYFIGKQILKSGTSIGANIQEALAGYSLKDFTAKMSISPKEAREISYWLSLIHENGLIEYSFDQYFLKVNGFIKMLTLIIKTTGNKISARKTTIA